MIYGFYADNRHTLYLYHPFLAGTRILDHLGSLCHPEKKNTPQWYCVNVVWPLVTQLWVTAEERKITFGKGRARRKREKDIQHSLTSNACVRKPDCVGAPFHGCAIQFATIATSPILNTNEKVALLHLSLRYHCRNGGNTFYFNLWQSVLVLT